MPKEKIASELDLAPQCLGCTKIQESGLCSTYLEPIKQWHNRMCPFHPSTAKMVMERTVKSPKFVNPLKASKRGPYNK